MVVILFLLAASGIIPGFKKTIRTTALQFWGVDPPQYYEKAIADFTTARPGTTITYRQFDPATYEGDLIDGLATGEGPDIIMFHSSWLLAHKDKLAPIPSQNLSLEELRANFPEVVVQDFTDSEAIYALPLYIDTLALLYNQSIFDSNAIIFPPKTWNDITKLTPALRKIGPDGSLQNAAITLGGTAQTIGRAPDILTALFLQTSVTNSTSTRTLESFVEPLAKRLSFYTQFSSSTHALYTWNEAFPNASEAFLKYRTAMMFGYASDAATLRDIIGMPRFAVAPFPQEDSTTPSVVTALYYGLAVPRLSKHQTEAWNFIYDLTMSPQESDNYLITAGRPPALKILINAYRDDATLGVFARQALIARSWWILNHRTQYMALAKVLRETIQQRTDSSTAIRNLLQNLNAQ